MAEILDSRGAELVNNVEALLMAVKSTNDFEAEMARRFGGSTSEDTEHEVRQQHHQKWRYAQIVQKKQESLHRAKQNASHADLRTILPTITCSKCCWWTGLMGITYQVVPHTHCSNCVPYMSSVIRECCWRYQVSLARASTIHKQLPEMLAHDRNDGCCSQGPLAKLCLS